MIDSCSRTPKGACETPVDLSHGSKHPKNGDNKPTDALISQPKGWLLSFYGDSGLTRNVAHQQKSPENLPGLSVFAHSWHRFSNRVSVSVPAFRCRLIAHYHPASGRPTVATDSPWSCIAVTAARRLSRSPDSPVRSLSGSRFPTPICHSSDASGFAGHRRPRFGRSPTNRFASFALCRCDKTRNSINWLLLSHSNSA